jgi:hypothetical protein
MEVNFNRITYEILLLKHHDFSSCFLLSNSVFSQTTLSAGDIAIVGVNTDPPKHFSFVS